MGVLLGLIPIIVWFVIIFSIIKAAVRASKASPNNSHSTSNRTNNNDGRTQQSRSSVSHNTMKHQLESSMEDRNNDWLAQQLRYERVAKSMVSDMFQLKQEHISSCDARYVRNSHHTNCDANGVDRAQY